MLHGSNDFESHELQQLRARMLDAFESAKMPPHWHEWSSRDEDIPYYLKGYGPFSVFINGKRVDINSSDCKRGDCIEQAIAVELPTVENLLSAFNERQHWVRLKTNLMPKMIYFAFVLPFFVLMIWPNSSALMVWPGHVEGAIGDLSPLSIRSLNGFLFPVLLITVNLAIASLFFRSYITKLKQPFYLALLAVIAMFSSKLINFDPFLEYGGFCLFVLASLQLCFTNKQIELCPRCASLRADKPVGISAYRKKMKR